LAKRPAAKPSWSAVKLDGPAFLTFGQRLIVDVGVADENVVHGKSRLIRPS